MGGALTGERTWNYGKPGFGSGGSIRRHAEDLPGLEDSGCHLPQGTTKALPLARKGTLQYHKKHNRPHPSFPMIAGRAGL